jgi:hypothetical protein
VVTNARYKKKNRIFLILLTLILIISGVFATDINTCGEISSPGEYAVINDLTAEPGEPCLSITVENVWIDGNMFTITGGCDTGESGWQCEPAVEFSVSSSDGNLQLINAELTYANGGLGIGEYAGEYAVEHYGALSIGLVEDGPGAWINELIVQDTNVLEGGVFISIYGDVNVNFENFRIKILETKFLQIYGNYPTFTNLVLYNEFGETKFELPITKLAGDDTLLSEEDVNIFQNYALLGSNEYFRFQDSNGIVTLDYNYHKTGVGPVMVVNEFSCSDRMDGVCEINDEETCADQPMCSWESGECVAHCEIFADQTTCVNTLGYGGSHCEWLPSENGELILCPTDVCSNLRETNSWSMDVNSFSTYSLYGIMDNGLRILRPKDEIFNTLIDGNWGIDIGGDMVAHIIDINADYYDINWINNIEKTYVIDVYDMNEEYNKRRYTIVAPATPFTYYELQPYLINKNRGSPVLIHTLSAVNSSVLPFIRIKVWKNIGEPTIRLVEDVITDDKGEAYVFLEYNGIYIFDTYYDNNIFIKEFNITATKPNIYLYLDLGSIPIPIIVGGLSASFTPISPSIKSLTTGTTTFTATLHNSDNLPISITTTIKTTNGIDLDSPQTWTGTTGNTFTFTVNNEDMNETLVITKIQVTTIDGNTYVYQKTYYTTNSFGANYNIYWGFSTGLKQDLKCSTDPNIPCFPLLTLAIIITIIFGLYLSSLAGQFGSQNISIIFAILLGLFTYVGWVPIILMGVVVFIVLVFVINERRS